MPLSTSIDLGVTATLTTALDLVTASAPLAYSKRIALASGTGANQADRIWSDTRTIAASSSEDMDLAGAMFDALGNATTFVKLKALMITAAAGNTNAVRVTRPATNGVPLFLAASDGLDVLPGGAFLWVAPNAAAVTVTGGTGDLINIANSSSGTPVTYDIVIIGTSA
jgi:hypothetical protein